MKANSSTFETEGRERFIPAGRAGGELGSAVLQGHSITTLKERIEYS